MDIDNWIRIALLVVWVIFGGATVIWWRRRHGSRHYPYSERASVILDALKQTADLGMVYWSKSKKRFLRRIVTPLELDGYSLKGFDHTTDDVRIFKVTRIQQIKIVPRGTRSMPSMSPASLGNWVFGVCGLAAMAFLVVVLMRGHRPQTEAAAPIQPPPPLAIVEPAQSSETNITRTPAPPPPTASAQPAPQENLAVAKERWEVIVENDPSYTNNQVAVIVKQTLRCSQPEAEEFERQVRSLGYAAVWQGPWQKAERLRQLLEAQDLLAITRRIDPK